MIMSVSTLTIGRGAATPVSVVNLSMAFCLSGLFAAVALHKAGPESKTEQPPASNHVELAIGAIFADALVAEGRAVDGAVAAMHDQFGDRAADRRRLLQAMSGKAVGEDEVSHLRV